MFRTFFQLVSTCLGPCCDFCVFPSWLDILFSYGWSCIPTTAELLCVSFVNWFLLLPGRLECVYWWLLSTSMALFPMINDETQLYCAEFLDWMLFMFYFMSLNRLSYGCGLVPGDAMLNSVAPGAGEQPVQCAPRCRPAWLILSMMTLVMSETFMPLFPLLLPPLPMLPLIFSAVTFSRSYYWHFFSYMFSIDSWVRLPLGHNPPVPPILTYTILPHPFHLVCYHLCLDTDLIVHVCLVFRYMCRLHAALFTHGCEAR